MKKVFNVFKKKNENITTIRDKIKDYAYFDNYIKEENLRIEKFERKLQNNEIKKDRIDSVKSKLFSIKFNLIIAKYSAGYDLDILKKEMEDLVLEWNIDNEDSYIGILQFISVSCLLNIHGIEIIKSKLKSYTDFDWLLQYILDFKNTKCDEKIKFKEFSELKKVVYGEDKKEVIIRYINHWYKNMSDCWWYDSHLDKNVNIYIGYWCFEIAVLLKILNINDEFLKENKYYPYDLAHYDK